jgi:tetratricopeptide (TPR) repeat protein
MELSELWPILKDGEGVHAEFKGDFTKQAHDIAKELAALANSGGGVLLLGVDDDGSVKGIPDADRAVERLAGIARSSKPPLLPDIGKLQLGKDLFIVYAKVPRSATVPYLYQGKFFIRVGSSTQEASGGDELITLLKNLGSVVPNPSRLPAALFFPPPSKGFKGRSKELERLEVLLAKKSVAIVIIEGISGIGKTALSSQFASTVDRFGYRAFWLDCRPETSFDSIISALAAFERHHKNAWLADILEDVTVSMEDRIARTSAALASEKMVLFLDDYQLVRDPLANRLLQKLVERSLELKIILICRWRPQLVASISPVRLSEEPLRGGLDQDACRQLMAECGLILDDEANARIWKLTGEGHPKALEIFIARSRTYPVSELLSSLPIFKEELTSEWLMPLLSELSEEEKSVAIDLSVFDRPFSYESMRKLYPERQTERLVSKLIDRFILDTIGDTSLRMHLLVRQFCYALIPDKMSKHVWAANYYLSESEADVDPERMTEEQIDALVGAWSHLIKSQEFSKAIAILNKLRPSLMSRGLYEQLMFLIEETPATDQDADWFSIHKARIFSLWGEFDAAVELIEPLVDLDNERIAREAILVLATIYNDHGKGELARKLLEAHHDRFMKSNSTRIQRRFLSRLVESFSLLGELDKALAWASKISQACEAEGDEIGGAISLRQMAGVSKAQKKPEIALSLCELSHNLLQRHGRTREAAITEMLLASTYADLGQNESAARCLRNSLETFTKIGDRKNSTICKQQLAQVAASALYGDEFN